MNGLEEALDAGKRRGYEEFRRIDGISFLFQYAIKRQGGVYCTYCFSVAESSMDIFEDGEDEEVREFSSLDDAMEHLRAKGAAMEKFAPIKRTLPF
ncbi:hypothetical protein HEP73_01857 [Xanthomonas sp. GW]|uniref:hypothetical protein n=1 Tax=unclassified Xanthomonas TaxID=2643310 RepID=UPI00163A1C98|nr:MULTISPECIES: hypothetical protein [unclassified Xanthomonas]QNH16646.1 hypothetical protein HEP74_01779 [Xanthomonas sp. SS]QNH20948.1 hypothetical protein HEP73_01857 [Xanthomonas sp. GW]